MNSVQKKKKKSDTKERFIFAVCGSTNVNWSRKPCKKELNVNSTSVYSLPDCDEKCT